jgi:CopG antitoxin of type II toxin-antitoxin system
MKQKPIDMPKFLNEGEEADWWASRQGRDFVKQKSAGPPKKGSAQKGSRLVGQLNRTTSVQIALRLPEPDVTKARELATRKGIGYQTLLKMLVHEGLRRDISTRRSAALLRPA